MFLLMVHRSLVTYALGLLLEICSHYGHHDETVKAGKWENNDDWCYWDYPMIELYGKNCRYHWPW